MARKRKYSKKLRIRGEYRGIKLSVRWDTTRKQWCWFARSGSGWEMTPHRAISAAKQFIDEHVNFIVIEIPKGLYGFIKHIANKKKVSMGELAENALLLYARSVQKKALQEIRE